MVVVQVMVDSHDLIEPVDAVLPEEIQHRLVLLDQRYPVAPFLLMIILGVYNGSARDVLIKAINICTECIGLG